MARWQTTKDSAFALNRKTGTVASAKQSHARVDRLGTGQHASANQDYTSMVLFASGASMVSPGTNSEEAVSASKVLFGTAIFVRKGRLAQEGGSGSPPISSASVKRASSGMELSAKSNRHAAAARDGTRPNSSATVLRASTGMALLVCSA